MDRLKEHCESKINNYKLFLIVVKESKSIPDLLSHLENIDLNTELRIILKNFHTKEEIIKAVEKEIKGVENYYNTKMYLRERYCDRGW